MYLSSIVSHLNNPATSQIWSITCNLHWKGAKVRQFILEIVFLKVCMLPLTVFQPICRPTGQNIYLLLFWGLLQTITMWQLDSVIFKIVLKCKIFHNTSQKVVFKATLNTCDTFFSQVQCCLNLHWKFAVLVAKEKKIGKSQLNVYLIRLLSIYMVR